MTNGVGISEHFPDIDEPHYLTWALAQTPLEHVTETTAALDRMHAHCNKTQSPKERLNPFAETAILDLLGVSAPDFESCVTQGNTPNDPKNVLIFGETDRGDIYTAIGDILAAGGHAVTVASADLKNRQRQDPSNPGITYLRKSMGELHKDDATPGFSLAILESGGGRLDKSQTIERRGEHKLTFSPQVRLRNTLRVIQPAGRLLITNATNVRHVNTLMTEDTKFAKEVDRSSFDLKYLYAYDPNEGRPHPIVPLAIFERRT